MSANELKTATPPMRRLRGVIYATVLLIGGGIVGAVAIGPTLGQGVGSGGQGQSGPESDGPRWHRFMDRQGDADDRPGWRRFMDRQMGRQDDEDDRPGRHRFMDRQMGQRGDQDDGPGWRRGFGGHRFGRQDEDGRGMGMGMGERMGMGMGMGQHMGEHMGRGFAGMMTPGAIERRVNRVLGMVDASTEQKQKVRAIFEKAANDLYGTRDQRQANRRAMAEALTAATIDKAKVEQLRTDRMKLADATSKRLTDAMVEAAEVLTPAQRADLAARFQRRGN